MIGNDLVALSAWAACPPERRKRLHRKLFHPAERALMQQAGVCSAWQAPLGWCLKEALYKAGFRFTYQRRWAPHSMHLEKLAPLGPHSWAGRGRAAHFPLQFQVERWGTWLHSLAWPMGWPAPQWQMQAARPTEIEQEGRIMRFGKDTQGLPWLREGHDWYPATLAHEGELHAWAWLNKTSSTWVHRRSHHRAGRLVPVAFAD